MNSGGWNFDFELTGRGWASATIEAQDRSVTLRASYLGDALGDLLGAMLLLLAGVEEARCSWPQEPGEVRWVLSAADEAVRVQVIDFHRDMGTHAGEVGQLLFDETGATYEVASAIAKGARRALDQYGEDGYLERWVLYPYPTKSLHAITERLRAIRKDRSAG